MINTSYKYLFLIAVLVVMSSRVKGRQIDPVEATIYEGVEIEMPQVQLPSFPDHEVNITAYGAVGNGIEKNTAAFAKAIDEVAQAGGGRVIVPRGIWLTGPVTLQSNINLHLEEGALVLFSRDFDELWSGKFAQMRVVYIIFIFAVLLHGVARVNILAVSAPKRRENRGKIRFGDFLGWGRNSKEFWPEYSPLMNYLETFTIYKQNNCNKLS